MATYEVDVLVVVMFEKVSVKTTVLYCHAVTPTVIVVVTCIRCAAGTSPGKRTIRVARITQAATAVLAMTGLLKSIPSRSSV